MAAAPRPRPVALRHRRGRTGLELPSEHRPPSKFLRKLGPPGWPRSAATCPARGCEGAGQPGGAESPRPPQVPPDAERALDAPKACAETAAPAQAPGLRAGETASFLRALSYPEPIPGAMPCCPDGFLTARTSSRAHRTTNPGALRGPRPGSNTEAVYSPSRPRPGREGRRFRGWRRARLTLRVARQAHEARAPTWHRGAHSASRGHGHQCCSSPVRASPPPPRPSQLIGARGRSRDVGPPVPWPHSRQSRGVDPSCGLPERDG